MAAAEAAPGNADVERLSRGFWTFFTASTVSALGDGMLVVGLPLLAAALTRSPVWIAAVVLMQRLAQLVLSLPAGAFVDRADPRRIAIVTNLAQAVLMLVSGLLIASGHFPIAALMVLAFLTEGMAALFNCATVAVVGHVVSPKLFGLANTRLRTAILIAAYVAGPGVGGLVFATGRQLPVFIDGASFVAAAAVLFALRLPAAEAKAPSRRHIVAEIKEGVRISFGQPALRLTALILGVLGGFQAAAVAVIVVLGTQTVHLGKTSFGLALACGNVVAPAAVLFLPAVRKMKTSSAVALGLVLSVAGETVLGTSTSAPQMSVGLALDATAVTIVSTALLTARMRMVPREVLGRMAGGFSTVILGAQTLGTVFGGLIAKGNVRAPYLTCAAVALLLLAVLYRRLPTLDAEPDGSAGAAGAATGGTAGAAGASTAAVPAQWQAQEAETGGASDAESAGDADDDASTEAVPEVAGEAAETAPAS